MPDGTGTTTHHFAVSLPPGTLVVERYVYISARGKTGVQWLAQKVTRDGSLVLIEACDTRRAALEAVST